MDQIQIVFYKLQGESHVSYIYIYIYDICDMCISVYLYDVF